jgi:hypothetical protein
VRWTGKFDLIGAKVYEKVHGLQTSLQREQAVRWSLALGLFWPITGWWLLSLSVPTRTAKLRRRVKAAELEATQAEALAARAQAVIDEFTRRGLS